MSPTSRFTVAAGLGLVAALWPSTPSGADATVVSVTKVTGIEESNAGPGGRSMAGTPPQGRSVVRYKDGTMRTETENGALLVNKDRVIVIDNQKKVWSATPAGRTPGALEPMLSMVKMRTRTAVLPGKNPKVILGKQTKHWIVVAQIAIDVPAMGAMLGGDSKNAEKPKPLTMKFRTEMWTTEEVNVGSGAAALGMGRAMPGSAMFKEMLDKMATIPGLPLRVVMTQSFDGMPAGDDGKPRSVVVTTEVVRLDEALLPAEQFQPPKGFRQVSSDSMGAAPAPLMGFPGGGSISGRKNPVKR